MRKAPHPERTITKERRDQLIKERGIDAVEFAEGIFKAGHRDFGRYRWNKK